MTANSILCYCATINKQIQTETLTQALDHLVLYHEMLQMRLEGGRYVSQLRAHDLRRDDFLSVYDCVGKPQAEIETLIGQIFKKLAAESLCERGAPIRAVLLNLDKNFNKLLLLSHRAVVDGGGLVLALEDLYRIYEQLSNDKKVALRPVHKTYSEFIKGMGPAKSAKFDDLPAGGQLTHDISESIISDVNCKTETGGQKTGASSVILDKNLKQRLFSWRLAEFRLTPIEALAGALLRSLIKAVDGDTVPIYIKSDYRFADDALKHTVGALTRTYMLPTDFAEKHGLWSDIKRLRDILRDILLHSLPQGAPQSAPQISKGSGADYSLRLNLEYLTAEPWLGGDEWSPEGFIVTEKDRLTTNYSIEVIPFFFSDRIEIFVEYNDTREMRMLVDKFADNLVPELEIILRYCEGYADAKEFWIKEFANAVTQIEIQGGRDDHKVINRGRALLARKVERSVIGRALLNLETDKSHLLLAAYSVLISRLSGCEDLILLCAFDNEGVNAVFPLRLNPAWSSSFKLFIEEVKGKLRKAVALSQYAFDILSEEWPKYGWPCLTLDIGYVYKQTPLRENVKPAAIGLLAGHPELNQDLNLVLDISDRDGDLDIRFVYEKGRFGAGVIKQFSEYISAILEDVAADANIKLVDIQFERNRKGYEMASSLAEDAFNF